MLFFIQNDFIQCQFPQNHQEKSVQSKTELLESYINRHAPSKINHENWNRANFRILPNNDQNTLNYDTHLPQIFFYPPICRIELFPVFFKSIRGALKCVAALKKHHKPEKNNNEHF